MRSFGRRMSEERLPAEEALRDNCVAACTERNQSQCRWNVKTGHRLSLRPKEAEIRGAPGAMTRVLIDASTHEFSACGPGSPASSALLHIRRAPG